MIDKNWKEYNEQLVKRGKILLPVESLKGWKQELRRMNERKRGSPFKHSESLILFLGMLKVIFGLPYRQLEGFTVKLGKLADVPSPDYSTLNLRISGLNVDFAKNLDSDE